MSVPDRYDAFWIPGLDDDGFDPDEALSIGFDWLDTADCGSCVVERPRGDQLERARSSLGHHGVETA